MLRNAMVLVSMCALVMAARLCAADAAPTTQAATDATDPIEAGLTEGAAAAKAVYAELLTAAKQLPADGASRPTPEMFYQWSRRMEFDGFSEAHLQRMRERLAAEEVSHAGGRSSRTNVMAYRYFVAEARVMAAQQAELRKFGEQLRQETRDALSPTTQPMP